MPVHAHAARCRVIKARDQIEQCALARPARPHQRQRFAGRNLQVNVFQNNLAGLQRVVGTHWCVVRRAWFVCLAASCFILGRRLAGLRFAP